MCWLHQSPSGSRSLAFPMMRELLDQVDTTASRPSVTLAFSAVEGFKEFCAVSADLAREITHLHNACVRETLSTCGGERGCLIVPRWCSRPCDVLGQMA